MSKKKEEKKEPTLYSVELPLEDWELLLGTAAGTAKEVLVSDVGGDERTLAHKMNKVVGEAVKQLERS